MTPICFIDTETDGVHPGRRVWEVAAIRRDDTGEHTYHAFVDLDLSTADLFGLRVGGFYQRHPLGRYLSGEGETSWPLPDDEYDRAGCYLEASQAAAGVAQLTHGAHLVGAVPSFDAEVLAALLRSQGLTPAWHYHLCDVEALAVGYLHGRAAGLDDQGKAHAAEDLRAELTLPWSSDALSRAVGVEPPGEDERHTALGDARHAMRLYDAITGGAA